MVSQLQVARDEYTKENDKLLALQKKQKTTQEDLEDLIEDTIDDVIEGVRREKTNFDNSWLPTYDFELDSQA